MQLQLLTRIHLQRSKQHERQDYCVDVAHQIQDTSKWIDPFRIGTMIFVLPGWIVGHPVRSRWLAVEDQREYEAGSPQDCEDNCGPDRKPPGTGDGVLNEPSIEQQDGDLCEWCIPKGK